MAMQHDIKKSKVICHEFPLLPLCSPYKLWHLGTADTWRPNHCIAHPYIPIIPVQESQPPELTTGGTLLDWYRVSRKDVDAIDEHWSCLEREKMKEDINWRKLKILQLGLGELKGRGADIIESLRVRKLKIFLFMILDNFLF